MSEELESCPVCGALPCDQVELVSNSYKLPSPTPEGRGGEELKPCPFCGGPGYAFGFPEGKLIANALPPRAIGCPDCQFFVGDAKGEDGNCIPRWNRRSPLLSSPRVEEVRREALEEAAKWIELVGRDWKADGQHEKRFAADYLAAGIRALSPPVG